MKTVSIGDTHGIAAAEQVEMIIDHHDKFIFLGDYVDSFDVDNSSMLKNLLDIIALKERFPEKIVLLWGNHDIHYFLGDRYYSSGYRPEMRQEFHRIFRDNEKLFQLAYQAGDFIWTHAGISDLWLKKRLKYVLNNEMTLADILNEAFSVRYPSLFDVGFNRGGSNIAGGPLWCDKEELIQFPLKGFNQIAGHNRVEDFEIIPAGDKKIILVDLLDNYEEIDASCFWYQEV